ncbi:cytochrome P450 [Mycolicibacterium conceptionense]|uniref:Cytochrome P450 n=2 Tax=Mycolicibacterium TaxID=1866885 RepID=A0A0U1CZW2_9MYCO|nr:cytochrome P450 [Mycolicibacterium conceptionense]OBB08649.1 cytochrome P450 [Mycolicibacterium conceptionense]OBE92313.1 cytochrome P450 [Mycolicibacterium conceptionense]OBF24801.1 cytochrome P450 [Mycolicibacterium conceptionense]OBF45003.1 cytochrome P450 [Mycolicibacterium conceptionense]OBI02217.1 cytochrome P450 [Mycolicibacterium conceptionense]
MTTTGARTPPHEGTKYPKLPHPPRRVPLLGDVFGMQPDSSMQNAMGMAELGPVCEFRFLGARYVVASGADAVADLNDEARFCKHVGPDIDALRIVGGDGLFTAYNDEPNWHKAHTLLLPAFSQAAMRRYHGVMFDVADELTDRWDRRAELGATVDVSADTTRVTLETIGRCAAGYSFRCFQDETMHPFVARMVSALLGADRLGVLRETFLPAFVYRRYERRIRGDAQYLHDLADDIVAGRRAGPPGHHDDLLQIMLESDLDAANIRYQLINFLIAGHETTSGALSFALYFLSQHPEVLARARDEVEQVWGDEQRPEFEKIAKLRYVRRVLDESLRLQPTVPAYYRAARQDTVLAGIHPMRKGDWALALTSTLHRDPRWGPEPDAFDPDRFAPEQMRTRPGGLYKPFGTGERSCIGRQFALHEAVLMLGVLIRRYDMVAEPEYSLRVQERLTMMPSEFRLELHRR